MQAIEKARETVLAELNPLERKEAELQNQIDEVHQSIAPLKAALKELTPSRKNKLKATRKDAKPCAKKPDVQAVCLALVEDNPSITKEELEELAKHKLVEELGFSRNGLALQLNKYLSSDVFVVAADGAVAIASAAAPIAIEVGATEQTQVN